MLALYVYSFLLLGRKLPRAHAGPSERCRDERRVDTVLVFIRREISRHLRGVEGAEPLSAANGLVYYVPGVVVWKGRRIAATHFSPSTYGVVASWRVEGDAELNAPSEPEYVLLDEYICNKEETCIETRCRRQNIGGQRSAYSLREPTAAS